MSDVKLAVVMCILFIGVVVSLFSGTANIENSSRFEQLLDDKLISYLNHILGPGTYYRTRNIKIESRDMANVMIKEFNPIDFTRLLPVMVSIQQYIQIVSR